MTEFFSIPQIIGYIALVIYVAGYAFKDDNKLKIIFSVSNFFWVVHYYLINAQTAALTTALVTVRNLLSLNSQNFSLKRKNITACVLAAAGMITWAGWISLVLVMTTIIVTFAMIYLKDIRLRQVFFLVDLGWLAHSIVVISFGGFVYAVMALIVNAITILRLAREGRSRFHGG